MNAPRLVIAAGGTGGHVAPGLAVARAWKGDSMLLGSSRGIEARMAAAAEIGFGAVPAAPLRRPLWNPRNLVLPFVVAWGTWKAMDRLSRWKADAVIATGGWVSVPVGLAAWLLGRPLVLHESNAWPGVATRLLARLADRVCLGMAEAARALPAGKTRVTGNPSRLGRLPGKAQARKKLGFPAAGPLVLVMPGSGAAVAVNRLVAEGLEALTKNVKGLRVLWMCGPANVESCRAAAAPYGDRVKVAGFIEDVATAYAAADLALTRAGSATLSELAAAGLPAVLVPYPYATGGHQAANARSLEKAGAAVALEEKGLTAGQLVKTLVKTLKDAKRRRAMSAAAKKQAGTKAASLIAASLKAAMQKGEEA